MATVVLTVVFAFLATACTIMAAIAETFSVFRSRSWFVAAAVCLSLAAWGVSDLVRAW
jgi:hypothetical protein